MLKGWRRFEVSFPTESIYYTEGTEVAQSNREKTDATLNTSDGIAKLIVNLTYYESSICDFFPDVYDIRIFSDNKVCIQR